MLLLLLALVAANLPWFSERLLFVVPLKAGKHLGWCLLELAVLYCVIGVVARGVEAETMGQVARQHWEFYVITACLFLMLALPGFVYRYLWRK
ncbi:MAG: DUF2818 family protein [Methylophilaceae bacterium]|nr:DUF2818 family protein [Methylophilaceae bacterium]